MRLFVLIFLISLPLSAQNIQTIAGGGPRNLAALQTGLAQPVGLAVDGSGNVYVSLLALNQIWKINSAGSAVTVFAGNGSFPYNGDGIQALDATLYQPQGLAFDAAGNLYVADTAHNRVRKIATSGVITTVAGNGSAGFSGDGSSAVSAQLNTPVGVAVDTANNLYIVDRGNQRIRYVSALGIISTFAGNGVAGFSGDSGPATSASLNQPTGVAVDTASNVYIADSLNFRVRKVVAGTISTVAGNGTFGYSGDGGPAVSAQLNSITGVTVDSFRNLFIVESYDVREIPVGSPNILTFAGGTAAGYSGDGGTPAAATFRNLAALATDSAASSFYLADAGNSRLRKAASNVLTTFAGNGTLDYNGNGLPAVNASLLTPNTVAVDNAGSAIFADTGSSSIRKLTLASSILSTAAGSGTNGSTPDGSSSTGPINSPYALTYDPSGNIYFVEENRVRKIVNGVYTTVANSANTAGFSGDQGAAVSAQFRLPSGLALAANGDLYVSDTQNNRVRVIAAQTGIVTTIAGTGTAASTGDGGLAINAALNYPTSLSLDGAGNLFVVELLGNRVRKIVLSTNTITTAAGDGTSSFADGVPATTTGLIAPFSIFADQSSNLFIADQGHSRVRKVTAGSNIISTVAGNGTYDFGGDGGPATAAKVNPLGIAIDRSQNLYIADSSGRLRQTPVVACFFTVNTPVYYVNSSGGSGSVTVTATNSSCPYTVASSSSFVTITSGASGTGSGTVTFSIASDPSVGRSAAVSIGGASFTITQAGTFAQSNVGFFQPTNGPIWALDVNGDGVLNNGDKFFGFIGATGDIAVTGDWNGDGRAKVGIYRNGFWYLDYNGNGSWDGPSGGDRVYAFGGDASEYRPVVGDWNADGRTKIGYYHGGFWLLDTNGNGQFDGTGSGQDNSYAFGGNGTDEVPLVGDWNGDHRTKVGFFFRGLWVLDYDGNGSLATPDKYYTSFTYYATGDRPVVGDWNGDGKFKIGIYRGGFWILDVNGNGTYDGVAPGADRYIAYGGNAGEVPIIGDWSGNGISKIGVYNNGFWTLDFNGDGIYNGGDRFIAFGGTPGNQPLIGRW